MRLYELTYIISPDLTAENLKEISEKIKSFIQEEAGVLVNSTEFEKKRLGFAIKNKKEGFLQSIEFSLSPEKLGNLEKKLRSENQILRFTIFNKKIQKETKVKEKPLKPKQAVPKKVELEEIDKKINEILKE